MDQNGRNVGVVAQDSRIFARGLEDKGALTVKWFAAIGFTLTVALPVILLITVSVAVRV